MDNDILLLYLGITIISSVTERPKTEEMTVMKWEMHSLLPTSVLRLSPLTLRREVIMFAPYQSRRRWSVGVWQFMHSVLSNMFCSISSMYCGFTGRDDYEQLGRCGWTNQFGDALPTLEFGNGFVPEFMGMGGLHSCFVSTDWSMICFGWNDFGQVQVLHFIISFELFGISCSLCCISSVTEIARIEEVAMRPLFQV